MRKYCTLDNRLKRVCQARNSLKAWQKKEIIVKKSGGQCIKCGYCKCIRSLQFHHIDPKTKKFSLNGTEIKNRSMDEIDAEAAKCMLLCSNCHGEKEDIICKTNFLNDVGMSLADIKGKDWSEVLLDIGKSMTIIVPDITIICETCKNEFKSKQYRQRRFCSLKCLNIWKRKVKWPSAIELTSNTIDYISEKYDVSTTTVKNWRKSYKKGKWG